MKPQIDRIEEYIAGRIGENMRHYDQWQGYYTNIRLTRHMAGLCLQAIEAAVDENGIVSQVGFMRVAGVEPSKRVAPYLLANRKSTRQSPTVYVRVKKLLVLLGVIEQHKTREWFVVKGEWVE